MVYVLLTGWTAASSIPDLYPRSESVGTAITKRPKLGVLNKNSFLTVLQAGKSKIKAHIPVKAPFQSLTGAFSLCPPRVEAARDLSGLSSLKTQIPSSKSLPSGPNHLHKAPLPNTIIFGA